MKEFLDKAAAVHGTKFDYSESKYINSRTKIKILCREHDEFYQPPGRHLMGHGCPSCAIISRGNIQRLSTSEFKSRAKSIHKNLYDYSKVAYTNYFNKVKITCLIHGEYLQSPGDHLAGCGCPSCNKSRGEQQIELFLLNNKIKFVSQKKFKDCRNKLPLPFDFYLIQLNICIEYDGEQHYSGWWRDKDKKKQSLKIIQKRDSIKNNYCETNAIKLIRIPYYNFNHIEKILLDELNYNNSSSKLPNSFHN